MCDKLYNVHIVYTASRLYFKVFHSKKKRVFKTSNYTLQIFKNPFQSDENECQETSQLDLKTNHNKLKYLYRYKSQISIKMYYIFIKLLLIIFQK